jgi:malate synthase
VLLTRSEYAVAVDACDRLLDGDTKQVMQRLLECIATYRVTCHHLAPLLHDAIAATDDTQHAAHLQSLLDELKRGEK